MLHYLESPCEIEVRGDARFGKDQGKSSPPETDGTRLVDLLEVTRPQSCILVEISVW